MDGAWSGLAWCAGLVIVVFYGARLGGLGGSEHADGDEVERTDEAVGDAMASCAGDGVAQGDRPVMLDEQQSGGRVRRYLAEDIPCILFGEDMHAVIRSGFGSGFGARLGALFAGD